MTSLTETAPQPMRSPWSFMGSVCLHLWVLAWVALGPALPLERQKSLYEREIQPYEKHIVWYKFTEKLPDIAPPAVAHDVRPLRAKAKFDQNIVSSLKDTDQPPQLIIAPAPETAPSKPLPLPNIVAVAPRRPPPSLHPSAGPADRALVDPHAPRRARREGSVTRSRHTAHRPTLQSAAKPKLPVPVADPVMLPAAPAVASAGPNLNADLKLPRQPAKFVPPSRRAPATASSGPASIAAPPPCSPPM
ncbi:MAG: hypothetical protein WDO73_12865 [Ignavibacteriota bacterium]